MFKHILLPTDGSPASERATAQAVAFAKDAQARITGLHVMPEFHLVTYQIEILEDTRGQFIKDCQTKADAYLSALKKAADKEGVPCDTVCVTGDLPHEAIVRMAQGKGCDVIVMASHGRKGMAGFLLGSETQKVLSHTQKPVLVLH
ncbi:MULTISPECIES: universal stress protein [unclassified Polaromonas]|uniref:universal stress protein n=1 Tax=unclassified Polaromonas TaxID=2638319 RepID=UPI000F09450B|nr:MULTISPECIES: universal stress protein [unclassified Polaromonas]AYQ28927.1 universal stress protein [Polaromonas sp. SP1]QGJ19956.1 universal stress protein [Polaromonas sp. Pch-P]